MDQHTGPRNEAEDFSKHQTINRPKPWAECGIEEKVERLRFELLNLRYTAAIARQTERMFENHIHDAQGVVAVPVRVADTLKMAGASGFDGLV